jgi:hypothetical protein
LSVAHHIATCRKIGKKIDPLEVILRSKDLQQDQQQLPQDEVDAAPQVS